MSKHGGDDLEDDFIPDDLVVLSEGEDGNYLDIVDEAFAFAEDGEVDDGVVATVVQVDTGNLDKKRKRGEKEKEKKAKVNAIPILTLVLTLLTLIAEKNKTCGGVDRSWP
jgi:protein CMS1